MSLRAQETLWWTLKSRCCDAGLSPKTLTHPGAILSQAPPPWPPGGPANALSLCIFCFVLFRLLKK